MLLVLVYSRGKGAPSLRATCSSSSQSHDLRVGACWAVPWRQVLGGGGGQSPSTRGLCGLAGLGEKAAGISAGCFPGEEKHIKEI